MTKTDRLVRLYPVPDHYFPGIRAVERLVPSSLAEQLVGGPNPAFTRQRPDDQNAPSDDALEDLSDIYAQPEFAPEQEPVEPVAVTEGDQTDG